MCPSIRDFMLADVKTKQLFLTIGSKAIAIHSSFKNHSNRNLHSKSTTTANEKTADRLFVWRKIIAMGKVGSSDLLVAPFPSQSFQTNSAFPGYSPFWKTNWIEGLFFFHCITKAARLGCDTLQEGMHFRGEHFPPWTSGSLAVSGT